MIKSDFYVSVHHFLYQQNILHPEGYLVVWLHHWPIFDKLSVCLFFFVPPAESAGPDRHTSGGRQSYPARQHRAGEYCGGANLPGTVENPQRLRPAERPGPARLPTAGRIT